MDLETLRLRLYGRSPTGELGGGMPLSISWEESLERLSRLPRMFVEPDGSFLWTGLGQSGRCWKLEGTLFDDGQVVRRVELIGNCPEDQWLLLLQALGVDWAGVSVQNLADQCWFEGQWLRSVALPSAWTG